jgi:hypothetical protein
VAIFLCPRKVRALAQLLMKGTILEVIFRGKTSLGSKWAGRYPKEPANSNGMTDIAESFVSDIAEANREVIRSLFMSNFTKFGGVNPASPGSAPEA